MSRLLRFLRAIRNADPGLHVTMAFGERLDAVLAKDDGVTLRADTLERALEAEPRRRSARALAPARRAKKPRRASPPTLHV